MGGLSVEAVKNRYRFLLSIARRKASAMADSPAFSSFRSSMNFEYSSRSAAAFAASWLSEMRLR